VNFTREPIIETIISPKEGYKLLVRNSKGENFEEYYVDAVEVVSFGRAFFFRSMERPKSFLVPVSDYEILEVKEARVALKNASHEKSIKIGGGREAPMRPTQREPKELPPPEEESAAAPEETALETAVDARMDRKRGRRHRRRRGGHEERGEADQQKPQEHRDTENRGSGEEETKGSSLFSSLIPPPPTLISETLSRYREKEVLEQKEQEHKEHDHKGHDHKDHGDQHKEPTSEAPPEPRNRNEEEPGADSTPLHRVSTKEDALQEVTSFNATYFTTFTGGGGDSFF
jgi:hypothetical protein